MPKSNERGFAIIFPVLVVGAILLLSFTFKTFKSQAMGDGPTVLSESDSGDNDDSDNSGSGSNNSGSSSSSETSKPSSSPESSTPKPQTEVQSSTPKPQFFTSTKTVKFSSNESELKKKLEKKQTPKASFKPNQTVKPESTEKPEIENEDEDETENEDSTPKPSGVPGVAKIKFELKSENGQIEFQGEKVSPSKDSPVSVDEKTGELTIKTPSGEKTVTFLPEDAVKSILGSNSVNEIPQDPETGKSELKLTINSNGVPVYEVEGIKKGRFLGIFSVNIKKTVQISAIDGAEGSVTVSGFDRFLDLLSF